MGLLPGALMRNAGLKFICKPVALSVASANSPFTSAYSAGEVIHLPVAHHDGNYTIDAEGLARLQGEDRIALRYVQNPNGSMGDIAGVLSQNRRVLGMMPHPERAVDAATGGRDGAGVFASLLAVGGLALA
jgi:phosphoribosylformylglycinamidine synthase